VNDFSFLQLFFRWTHNIGNKELKPKNTTWLSKSGILYSVIHSTFKYNGGVVQNLILITDPYY